jgi:hypothetical protein
MLFDLVKPRTIELGKIKIGGKSPQERTSQSGTVWRAPEKYDHFKITTLNRDSRGDLIQDTDLMESLCEEHADSDGHLRQIPIAVLSNDIEDIVQAGYVQYVGKRIASKSDGKTLTVYHRGGKWLDHPIVTDWKPEMANVCDAKGNRVIKLHTTFSCIIAAANARWGGFYKFRTTSGITASQLVGSLVEIKQLTGGVLRGLPLRLVVRPLQVAPDGKVTTVYVVHCELVGKDLRDIQRIAVDQARYELANAKQIGATQREYRKLLAAPGDLESPAEQAEVAEEFHPEAVEANPPAVDPLAAALGLTGPVQDAEFAESKPVELPTPPAPKINGTQAKYATEDQQAALGAEGRRLGWDQHRWQEQLKVLKVRGGIGKLTAQQAEELLAQMRNEGQGQDDDDPEAAMNAADWLSDFGDRVDAVTTPDALDALGVELEATKGLTDAQYSDAKSWVAAKASRMLNGKRGATLPMR